MSDTANRNLIPRERAVLGGAVDAVVPPVTPLAIVEFADLVDVSQA